MGAELLTDRDTGTVVASPTVPGRSPVGGGRRPSLPRIRRGLFPYLLLVPALAGLGAGVIWPIYRMAVMSTQDFGLSQQFGQSAEFVGLENFRAIFGNDTFWGALRRSLIFMIVNVALTMGLGVLMALLLSKLGRVMRFTLTAALLLVWAAPPLTASILWQWMFDTRFGVVNEALSTLGLGFEGHNWLAEPFTFFFVATIIVVWMGLPFVAFTLYAAMTQVSGEVVEAAKIDGAGAFQRFRDVTWPAIKPVFLVMAMLSTVWDLRVFTQIFVLQQGGGLVRETNLLGTWGFRVATGGGDFGQGAASALVLLTLSVFFSLFYIRHLFKRGEVV